MYHTCILAIRMGRRTIGARDIDGNSRPRQALPEFYEDSQPAVGLDVLAVEVVPAGSLVQNVEVGSRNRLKDHVDVIE